MDQPDPAQQATPAHTFRTYASDLAKMSEKTGVKNLVSMPVRKSTPIPVPPAPKAAPVPAAPKPASTHPAAAPVLPPVVAQPIPPAPVPPKAPEPQPVPPAPTRAYEPPPADIIPKAPSTDESREQVLARLRARVTPAIPAVASQPVEAPPATVIPKAPSTDEKREEVLARLRAKTGAATLPTPPPAPRAVPTAPAPIADPSPIHTYKTDFSDKAKREKASPISILAAEQNASVARSAPEPEQPKGRFFLIAGAVLLILAGGASVFFAYAFITGKPVVPVALNVPSLIFGDEYEELRGSNAELREGLVSLGARLTEGEVAIAYLTAASTTPKGTTVLVPAEGGALIGALELPAPAIVKRHIATASTVGSVRSIGEALPFFILRVTSYDRTFAGMLSWEPTMERDLAFFYPSHPEVEGETASSTPPVTRKLIFRDEIIENHDVRVLRDNDGRAVMLYGYRDKETLIIARNEAAFITIMERLAATRAR